MATAEARESFDVVLGRARRRPQVGVEPAFEPDCAERLISTLTKAWRHRGDRVLDHWELEPRAENRGVVAAFATRVAAAAAADAVFWGAGAPLG